MLFSGFDGPATPYEYVCLINALRVGSGPTHSTNSGHLSLACTGTVPKTLTDSVRLYDNVNNALREYMEAMRQHRHRPDKAHPADDLLTALDPDCKVCRDVHSSNFPKWNLNLSGTGLQTCSSDTLPSSLGRWCWNEHYVVDVIIQCIKSSHQVPKSRTQQIILTTEKLVAIFIELLPGLSHDAILQSTGLTR
jgi:hypothetical protein